MKTIEMEAVRGDTEQEAEKLRERSRDEIGEIIQNRYVSHNKPVLAGTRIRTEAVWNFHEAGYSVAGILRQYPRLTAKDVEKAIEFESRCRRRVG